MESGPDAGKTVVWRRETEFAAEFSTGLSYVVRGPPA